MSSADRGPILWSDGDLSARLALEQLQIITSDSGPVMAHAVNGDIRAVARAMRYPTLALSYLFYGIEIGRALEREQIETHHG